ncbi:uncharacterized protein N7500_000861 [Penicillium coprophilum]|uniref:uncharacterized protein n=1 Tax=Penicillium coprophilum TaxID=36646 RepID=UPI0023920CDB|nr:uncharacterized protein N7500_000861 [Penicillium coprophilum]KAJ5178162.1 hypothetical protein N7500_000861 [Penicillium coprophilum]
MSQSASFYETTTATQRALGIAEIVGHIISFLPQELYGPETDLISSALVSNFWLAEALPLIWRQVYVGTVQEIFSRLDPSRRQFYANFVTFAHTRVFNDLHTPQDSPCDLNGIVFPKMTELLVFVNAKVGECSLSNLNCPNLRRMTFASWGKSMDSGRIGAQGWESIFWDLPTKYPSLKELGFIYPPGLYPHALGRLKARHPNLLYCLDKPRVRWTTTFLPDGSDESDGFKLEDIIYDYDIFEDSDMNAST